MSDLKPATKSAPLQTAPAPEARPAAQLHGRQVGSGGPAVLDLRPKAASTPADSTQPLRNSASSQVTANTSSLTSSSPALAEVKPAEAKPVVVEEPVVAPKPVVTPVAVPAEPVAEIKKAAPAAIIPQAAPTPVVTTPAPNPDKHPDVQRFDQHPAVSTSAPALPNVVAAQVDAMSNMTPVAPPAEPSRPKAPALEQALQAAKPTPNIVKMGAAVASIALMSGLVWMQNSPKMAFRSAAAKAGIDASLPTYVPSSYRQNGPVSVGQGQITLNFSSPSDEEQLKIAQRRTDWDSNSLRENFVAKQSNNYLAVQGQGLTIYMFDDYASWVNHGVWYTISGTAKLSREQVLRMAYGL